MPHIVVDKYYSCDQVTAQDLQMQVDSKVKESVPKHYSESVDFCLFTTILFWGIFSRPTASINQ